MAAGYAGMRVQFGRPIGSFQAIKHMCADMLTELEAARSAAYYGLWTLEGDSQDVPLAASLAKVYCSAAYSKIAGDVIQVHGGIGFTWEHPVHLYFKARDRVGAGASLAGLSYRLVDAWIAVRLMRVTALRTIGELVAGRPPGPQAATAKLYASVQHQRLLELATELLAEEATVTGDGYALEPLPRAFLLSRAETIYGGSSQIQRNIIGERVLGLPREPRPV